MQELCIKGDPAYLRDERFRIDGAFLVSAIVSPRRGRTAAAADGEALKAMAPLFLASHDLPLS